MVKVKLRVLPVDVCGAAVIELITLRPVIHFRDYAVCVVGTVSEPSCKQVHSQDAEDQPDKQNDQQRVAHGGCSGRHDPKHHLHRKKTRNQPVLRPITAALCQEGYWSFSRTHCVFSIHLSICLTCLYVSLTCLQVFMSIGSPVCSFNH